MRPASTSALSALALNNLDATSSSGATRYSGPDRYATSAAVVRKAFPSAAPTVFITTGADFPDALSAGAAAASMAAPLLLVSPTAIPAAVATELQRLAPSQIYVVGGTSVVSLPVEAALRGFTTSRSTSSVSGSPDRIATRRRLPCRSDSSHRRLAASRSWSQVETTRTHLWLQPWATQSSCARET